MAEVIGNISYKLCTIDKIVYLIITVNASSNGNRGQSGSVIAIRSNRSLWTCWNVSHVDVQLAIEKIAVISAKTIDQIQ